MGLYMMFYAVKIFYYYYTLTLSHLGNHLEHLYAIPTPFSVEAKYYALNN